MQLHALVTGASSGIGAAFARALAARGANLILTARRREPLEALASELGGRVPVQLVCADLGTPEGASQLWNEGLRDGVPNLLINNAGFGTFRVFGETDWARDAEMMQLNMTSLAELSHAFVRAHQAQTAPAYLLNVASVAAYQAVPRFAVYAASKAFVLSFTEALHDEARGTQLHVTALCPGGTKTAFHSAAGAGDYGMMARLTMQGADEVAAAGLRGVLAGRRIVVPGLMNKLTTFLQQRMPRRSASRLAAYFMGETRRGALPARREP